MTLTHSTARSMPERSSRFSRMALTKSAISWAKPRNQSSSQLGRFQPAFVSSFSVKYSFWKPLASGAKVSMASLAVMLALMTPSVMKAVTRVFNPPRPTSLMTMLPRLPSSKAMTRLAQFSTSTGLALIHWCAPACRGRVDEVGRVRQHRHGPDALAGAELPFPLLEMEQAAHGMDAHAQQRAAADGFPVARKNGIGPGMIFLRAQFQYGAFRGRNQPPHLVNRRGIDPVFRVAKFHAIFLHGGADGFGVLARPFAHFRAWHVQANRFRVARLAKIARERLFHDDMLARVRGADGKFMVQRRRYADVDDVNVRAREQGVEAVGH